MYRTQIASLAVAESTLSRHTADEYRDSILEHMVRMDKETRPDPTMIDQQPEISWNWWPVLVNMMVDMHWKLGLEPQTLFMAVNIVNRYCARRIVYQKHFRLVGVTAMWIAAKYEDKKSSVPTLRLLRHMAGDSYAEEMFVMMEGHILNTLNWSIPHCTVDSFLRTLLAEGNPSPLLMSLTSYIAEITLYHKVFVGKDPLMIARAINTLALHLLNVNTPPPTTESEQKWHQWVPTLADVILSPPQAILDKYRSPDRIAVTQVVDGWILRRQRQAQEEAALKARAQAKAEQQQLRLNVLSRQASTASLPLTPPPSATRTSVGTAPQPVPKGDVSAHSGYDSEFATPSSSTINSMSDHSDSYGDSPLALHSLASLTSLSSVTSLSSASSMAPPHHLGIFGPLSQSPPATPLNPPKPYFRV